MPSAVREFDLHVLSSLSNIIVIKASRFELITTGFKVREPFHTASHDRQFTDDRAVSHR